MSIFAPILAFFRQKRYVGSSRYWEQRYAQGGHSGTGSSGLLAQYKALIVNDIVWKNNIETVLELGCGDGQQLQLADYPDYIGLDISQAAITRCQKMFAQGSGKRFLHYQPAVFDPETYKSDLALSLEVIFHLTEDAVYETYLRHLFAAAEKLVVIFSLNMEDTTGGIYPHFRPRMFLADIPRLAPGWVLREQLVNPHRAVSQSDFFIFEKRAEVVRQK